MRIVSVECWMEALRLTEPYTIAYSTTDTAENVFLRLTTADGREGHGATNPDPEVTGETPAATLDALRPIAGRLIGRELDGEIPDDLEPILAEKPSVRACLDMALLDLLGQIAGLPVHELFGVPSRVVETYVTIGILPVLETLQRARHWTHLGFRHLKVKGGRDPALDLDRVEALRAELDPGVRIGLDANQGYSFEDSSRFLARAGSAITFLEQPTPHDRPELLGKLQQETPVPVIADESLTCASDLERLLAGPPPAVINIKLVKVGGLRPALALEERARNAGLATMIGCMDESSLGIAAALHAALAFPSLRFVDLDGHVFLEDDPGHPRVPWSEGRLRLPSGTGLGVGVRRPV